MGDDRKDLYQYFYKYLTLYINNIGILRLLKPKSTASLPIPNNLKLKQSKNRLLNEHIVNQQSCSQKIIISMRSEPKPQESNYYRRPGTHHSSRVCSIVDPGKCMNLSALI